MFLMVTMITHWGPLVEGGTSSCWALSRPFHTSSFVSDSETRTYSRSW